LNKMVGASVQLPVSSGQSSVVSGQPSVNPAVVPPDADAIPEGFEPIPSAVVAEEVAAPATLPPSSVVGRPSSTVSRPSSSSSSMTRPSVPASIAEFFLPMNMSFTRAATASGQSLPADAASSGIIYRPTLVASAQVRFLDRKYNLDTELVKAVLVTNPDKRGVVRWDDHVAVLPTSDQMDPAPDPQARFASLDSPLSDARLLANLQRDFADWVYRMSKITIRSNQALGLFATPDVSQAEFIKACADAADQARDDEMAKATATIDRQIKTLKEKIAREERELKMDESELQQRKGEELATHAENLLGVFGGRRSSRRLSSSLTKRRMTEQAKEDVDESIAALNQYDQEMKQLEEARQQALEEAGSKWENVVNDISEIPVIPKKTDIYVQVFGVAWMPYYQIESRGGAMEFPAFGM
jgi:hypothetical protein